MDIVFKCSNCDQELEVDASGAGTQINCPSCNASITVPNPEPANIVTMPEVSNAARLEEKHYAVPVHDKAPDVLIKKPARPLEIAAKDGDKKIRIRTIRRSDCQEVGRDHFDQKVSEFLDQIGQPNIISISAINYSHPDAGGHNIVMDYGVLIVFKG
jgi:DNA-directed RNA polymerase subunit RPC12/RpoP